MQTKLEILSLIFSLMGSISFARGLFITDKKAIELGTSRYSFDNDKENLRLPAVHDRIVQRKYGIIGAVFAMLAFVTQAYVILDNQSVANPGPDSSLFGQLYNIEVPKFYEYGTSTDPYIRLHDGKVEEHGTDGLGTENVFLGGIYLDEASSSYAVADLNKDGLDDVVATIGYTGGGSGYFYDLAVFMNDKGVLKYLTAQDIGDRIKINKISYDSGVITADIITQGSNEPMCCGTTHAKLQFRLKGNVLVPIK